MQEIFTNVANFCGFMNISCMQILYTTNPHERSLSNGRAKRPPSEYRVVEQPRASIEQRSDHRALGRSVVGWPTHLVAALLNHCSESARGISGVEEILRSSTIPKFAKFSCHEIFLFYSSARAKGIVH